MNVLKVINDELKKLKVDYHYLYNGKTTVTYPYVTGEYFESGYTFEDGRYNGSFILEMWNRGSNIELIKLNELIKEHFRNFTHVSKGESMHISYASTSFVRTNEENLYKIETHLDIVRWKGN